jgi:hypothetical protein
MPHPRQRPRIAANGRTTIRLSTWQRDLFLGNRDVPAALAFALKHAPVRDGKLGARVSRQELDALILAAAKVTPPNKARERELNALLGYLEDIEDRFEDPEADE